MKRTKTLVTCLAAFVFTAPVLRAENDEEGDVKERILAKFDTDKDGALSKTELAAAPERLSKRLLENWDTNKDGELSKMEIDAIKPLDELTKDDILAKLDTNKDGMLSKDELAMRERLGKRLLEKWDTNKDGELSKEEIDAIKPPAGFERRKERREERREERKENREEHKDGE